MPTIYIAGANRTAQWYADDYEGTTFPRVDKFLLHTTETGGWPGYEAGAKAPNATYYPKWRQIRQHFGINRSSRALRDPSSTLVRENRDNVFQLELICYSQYSLAVERGGLWVGDLTTNHMRDIAAIALQCHRDWGLPLTSTVQWREGRKTYYNDVRLTGPQFDAYRGILGHVHASGNDHWDPGGFRYSRLEDALSYQLVNHPIYGEPVPIPPPPVIEPEIPLTRKAPDMIMVKQAGTDRIWLIDGQVRRHVATWSAAQALAAAGVPLDTEHPISSELLRSLTPQPQGPDVTDA
ncbi:MAG TPA: hypothetical protein VFR23_15680 [Jiangellaceae bacterium]|nr:hypothetical protein [Jiangellaceae bacterium]